MGTWDTGPFDNDAAEDFAQDLDDAAPGDRPELVREALSAAADNADHLDSSVACVAIAAAAVVASQQPGGPEVDSSYGPDFLIDGGKIDLPEDYVELAVRAIARVLDADSEWRELWEESDGLEGAIEGLEPIRAALSR
jgi:hypothetical protein